MSNELLTHLIRFAGALRRAGLSLGIGNIEDAYRSLLVIDLADREGFRLALRANLVHRHEDLARFDRLFEAFWPVGGLTVGTEETLGLAGTEALRPELVLGAQEARTAGGEESAAREATTPAARYGARDVFWAREVGRSRGRRVGRVGGVGELHRLLAIIPGA